MKLRLIAVLAFAALLANAVIAHGDKKHVLGTLEKINADSVVVKTSDGKSVEIKLAPSTTYVSRDGKAAKLSDLAVGERVVIHATPNGDTLSADEIKFSPAGAANPTASGAKPRH
jgi:Domain of unknown function (DUF5666)